MFAFKMFLQVWFYVEFLITATSCTKGFSPVWTGHGGWGGSHWRRPWHTLHGHKQIVSPLCACTVACLVSRPCCNWGCSWGRSRWTSEGEPGLGSRWPQGTCRQWSGTTPPQQPSQAGSRVPGARHSAMCWAMCCELMLTDRSRRPYAWPHCTSRSAAQAKWGGAGVPTPAFFWFPFAWNIFFHPFTFSLYVSLGLKWISCRQHMYGSCFVSIQPVFAFWLEHLIHSHLR